MNDVAKQWRAPRLVWTSVKVQMSLGACHNLALFGTCCSRFENSICTNNFTAHAVKLFASVLNVTKTISADTSNTAKQWHMPTHVIIWHHLAESSDVRGIYKDFYVAQPFLLRIIGGVRVSGSVMIQQTVQKRPKEADFPSKPWEPTGCFTMVQVLVVLCSITPLSIRLFWIITYI